jgi:hypothetical protein
MKGDSETDTLLLQTMSDEARRFLMQFQWCERIAEFYFGAGVGGIVAVFVARIVPNGPGIDEWLWTVVGDLPPACLVTDDSSSPGVALRAYIEEMRKWVGAALEGESVEDLIPVNAPATRDNAEALGSRLTYLETTLIPMFERRAAEEVR